MESALFITLVVFVSVVMLFGIITLIIPVLPGLTIIWLAALLYGLVEGFNTAGWIIIAVLTILMLIGNTIDNVIVGKQIRQTGTSWLTIGVALVAGIIGTFVLPPLGGLLFTILTLFLFEFYRLRNWRKALQAAKAMIIGMGWSTVLRVCIGFVMIILWLLWAFPLRG